jgi:hypothetical protein
MTRPLKRLLLALITLILSPVLGLVSFYAWVHFAGNFHEVGRHEVYRSGQLNATELAQRTQQVGLKSILNLRGENLDAPWYQEEIITSKALGLLHLDFSLSASTPVKTEQLKAILQLIDSAPKPLLIHCTDGADRSGLVSAVYLLRAGENTEKAKEQLSWRFGHFPHLLWTFTRAMDESLDLYLSESP